MKTFYALLLLLWLKTKLTVYQSINLTGINLCLIRSIPILKYDYICITKKIKHEKSP
jgi:hypothetical protein